MRSPIFSKTQIEVIECGNVTDVFLEWITYAPLIIDVSKYFCCAIAHSLTQNEVCRTRKQLESERVQIFYYAPSLFCSYPNLRALYTQSGHKTSLPSAFISDVLTLNEPN